MLLDLLFSTEHHSLRNQEESSLHRTKTPREREEANQTNCKTHGTPGAFEDITTAQASGS